MTIRLVPRNTTPAAMTLFFALIALKVGANPLFEDDTPLEATLTAPLAEVFRQTRAADQDYFGGEFRYVDANGEQVTVSVNTRTRGAFRRRHCERPPLRLNFKKKELSNSLLAGQDKLKLVAACNRGREFEQLVVLEYLAYQLFDVVSDGPSFAVRPMTLTMTDSEQKLKTTTSYAFLIEDEKDMAARHGLENVSLPSVEPAQLNPQHAAVMELFQYMIGNTDFSPLAGAKNKDCCHNIKLVRASNPALKLIPVPYDFDSAGLIDAPYAGPAPKLPIRSVRKRYFMGLCRSPEYFDNAAALFIERRDALYAVFDEPALQTKYRKRASRYLDGFFKTLTDSKRLAKLADKCQGGSD